MQERHDMTVQIPTYQLDSARVLCWTNAGSCIRVEACPGRPGIDISCAICGVEGLAEGGQLT